MSRRAWARSAAGVTSARRHRRSRESRLTEPEAPPAPVAPAGEQAPPPARRSFWWAVAHVFLLAGVAVAAPLLDITGRNAEFFVAHHTGPLAIVLFALGLVLVPPLPFVALLAVARRVGPRAFRAVHLAVVALLVGVILLRPLKSVTPSALRIGAGAAVAALALTFAYAKSKDLRDVLNWCSPAPLVIVLLFLFHSSVTPLVFPNAASAGERIASTAPVVFVLFDEFPSQSVMDASYDIDAHRFPHLAEFAKGAYWFRNATSVDDFTPYAVPALLSGQRPGTKLKLPVASEYPGNLFTMFGRNYTLHAEEAVTDLCPRKLCEVADRQSGAERAKTLLTDSGLIYLHVVLPPRFEKSLPSISNSWANFAQGASGSPGDVAETQGELTKRQQERFKLTEQSKIGRLMDAFSAADSSLYFTHLFLPHLPWRYLPTGQSYPNAGPPEGLVTESGGGKWGTDATALDVGIQRHLLQVGYVDRVIGEMVARLKAVGLYDKALIVFAADHGASFVPGTTRRAVQEENADEVMPQALFVKAPHQTKGVVSDRNVESIDVLPTIADLLDVPMPYRADGVSALDTSVPERPGKLMKRTWGGEVRRPAKRPDHFVFADQIARTFPRRDDEFDLYAFGPAVSLVGKDVSALPADDGPAYRGALKYPKAYENVDPAAGAVPVYAPGVVDDDVELVALALNGRVVATGRTFGAARGDAQFSLLFPPSVLRKGANTAELFAVVRSGGELRLRRVAG